MPRQIPIGQEGSSGSGSSIVRDVLSNNVGVADGHRRVAIAYADGPWHIPNGFIDVNYNLMHTRCDRVYNVTNALTFLRADAPITCVWCLAAGESDL